MLRKRIIEIVVGLGVALSVLMPRLGWAQQPVVPVATLAQSEAGSPQAVLALGAYLYKNITTDTTTVVKSGVGILHTLTFNAPTATTVVTLYDNTAASGTKIGTITVPASPMPVTLTYDVAFSIGLTVVTGTATSDITVSYQ